MSGRRAFSVRSAAILLPVRFQDDHGLLGAASEAESGIKGSAAQHMG